MEAHKNRGGRKDEEYSRTERKTWEVIHIVKLTKGDIFCWGSMLGVVVCLLPVLAGPPDVTRAEGAGCSPAHWSGL
jgi:hypothetical protein